MGNMVSLEGNELARDEDDVDVEKSCYSTVCLSRDVHGKDNFKRRADIVCMHLKVHAA